MYDLQTQGGDGRHLVVLSLHSCRLIEGLELLFHYIIEIFFDPSFITTLVGCTGPAAGIGAHGKQVACKRLYEHILGCSLSLFLFLCFLWLKVKFDTCKDARWKNWLAKSDSNWTGREVTTSYTRACHLFAMTEFRTCDEKRRGNSRLLCRSTA